MIETKEVPWKTGFEKDGVMSIKVAAEDSDIIPVCRGDSQVEEGHIIVIHGTSIVAMFDPEECYLAVPWAEGYKQGTFRAAAQI